MKQGTTVQELLHQVQQNADYKRDFKCPTSALTMLPNGNVLLDTDSSEMELLVSGHAHRQIGSTLRLTTIE